MKQTIFGQQRSPTSLTLIDVGGGAKLPPLSVFSKFLDKRFEISAQDFLTFPNFYLGTLKKKIGTIDLLDHRKHDRFSEGPRDFYGKNKHFAEFCRIFFGIRT